MSPAAATTTTTAAAAAAAAWLGCTRSFGTKEKGKRVSAPSAGPLYSKPSSPFELQRQAIERWFAAAAAAVVQRGRQLQELQQQQPTHVTALLQQPQQLLLKMKQQQVLNQYKRKLTDLYGPVYVDREWPVLRFVAQRHFQK